MRMFARNALDPIDLRSLSDHLGARAHVLTWARTGGGPVVALPDRMSIRVGDSWQDQPWHDIDRGGWDEAASTLSWRDAAGAGHTLALAGPGRLPEVFNERVSASIVLQKVVDLPGRRRAVVSLRRNLGTTELPLVWRVTTDADLSDPRAAAVLAAERARLSAEYDIA